MKLQDQIDLLNGTEGVLEAWLDKEPQPVGRSGKLHAVTVIFYFEGDGVRRKGNADLLISDYGKKSEDAGWLGEVPIVLRTPVELDHGPLGSEADILAFLPVRVLKAEIERGENEARVVGHELVDGVAVPVTFMLYTDGQTVKVVREASAQAAVKEAVR